MKTLNTTVALVHEILHKISEHEVIEALLSEGVEDKPEIIRVNFMDLKHGEGQALNWRAAMAQQRKFYEEIVAPQIKSFKDCGDVTLYYFGAAPISLAMHLGYLMRSWDTVNVFLKLHEGEKNWLWPAVNEAPFELTPLPNQTVKALVM